MASAVALVAATATVIGYPPGAPSAHAFGTVATTKVAGDAASSLAVSVNGRYSAFAVNSPEEPGDTNGTSDVYLYDHLTTDTSRLSVPTDVAQLGKNPTGRSWQVSMTSNGSHVAFMSMASNLGTAGADANNDADLWVLDRTSLTAEVVSLDGAGDQLVLGATQGLLSRDGSKAAFATFDSLDPADTDSYADVYVRDLTTGAVTFMTPPAAGMAVTSAHMTLASVANNGKVVFVSASNEFVAASGDTNAKADAFISDGSSVARVSVASAGGQLSKGVTWAPSVALSLSGTQVSFQAADNAAPGGSSSNDALYVRDLSTGTTTLASTPDYGTKYVAAWPSSGIAWSAGVDASSANQAIWHKVIGSSATRIATGGNLPGPGGYGYASETAFAMSNDTRVAVAGWFNRVNSWGDGEPAGTWLFDTDSTSVFAPSEPDFGVPGGSLTRNTPLITGHSLSRLAPGNTSNFASTSLDDVRMSGDGAYAVFSTFANLDGTNSLPDDVYRYDMATGELVNVSGGSGGRDPSISYDGQRVSYRKGSDVYVWSADTGTREEMSKNMFGVSTSSSVDAHEISGNGQFVVMETTAADLIADDTNSSRDVYRREIDTGDIERISVAADGDELPRHSNMASVQAVSYDGTRIAFQAYAVDVGAPGPSPSGSYAEEPFVWDGADVSPRILRPLPNPDAAYDFRLASNGLRLVVEESYFDNWLHVIDLASGQVVSEANTSSAGVELAGQREDFRISGDGRYVALLDYYNGNTQPPVVARIKDTETGQLYEVVENPPGAEECGNMPNLITSDIGFSDDFTAAAFAWVSKDASGTCPTYLDSPTDRSLYEMRLQIAGAGAAPRVPGAMHPATGPGDDVRRPWMHSVTDLTVPAGAQPIAVTRTYSSAPSFRYPCGSPYQPAFDEPFGPGWTHSYNIQIAPCTSERMALRTGDGSQELFVVDPVDPDLFVPVVESPRTLERYGPGWILYSVDGSQVVFDTDGRWTSMLDRFGNSVLATRNLDDQISLLTDVHSRDVEFTYNADGLISNISAGTLDVTYGYDSIAADQLLSTTGVDGTTEHYRYDASGLVDRVTDQTGIHTATVVYDSQHFGQTASVTDSAGDVTTYDWDPPSRTLSVTNPFGGVTATKFSSDNHAQVVTVAAGMETRRNFGPNGLVESVDEFDNIADTARQTRFDYDGSGSLEQVTWPDGRYDEYAYNGRGQPEQHTDNAGRVTTWVYDTDDVSLMSMTLPAVDSQTATWQFDVDGLGRVEGTVSPEGETTSTTYRTAGNGVGLPSTTTDGEGRTTTYLYDAAHNLTAVHDSALEVWDFEIDAAGRMAAATDPTGSRETWEYDLAGRLVEHASGIDTNPTPDAPPLAVVTYGYDAAGRIDEMTGPGATPSTYAYNTSARTVTTTSPEGRETKVTLDAFGRQVAVATPSDVFGQHFITRFEYNGAGQVVRLTRPSGTVEHFAYIAESGALRERWWVPAGGQAPAATLTFDYDDDTGELVTVSADGTGDQTFSYDERGRVTSAAWAGQTIEYGWDADDRLAQRTYPDGVQLSYSWYGDGQLDGIIAEHTATTPGIFEPIAAHTYDTAGRLATRVTNGGAAFTTWFRDDAGRPTGVQHRNASSTVFAETEFTLDAAGWPVSADVIVPSSAATTASRREFYSYSPERRLDQRCVDAGPSPTATGCGHGSIDLVETWSFDDDGNRTGATSTAWSQADVYSYDLAGRLEQVSGEHDWAFGWDPDGNQTTDTRDTVTTTRVWNAAGQLASVDGVAYGYDPSGRRVYADDGVSVNEWWWDPLADEVYSEHLDDSFVWRNVAGMEVEDAAGAGRWVFDDLYASPLAELDDAGAVTGAASFDPWGEELVAWNPVYPAGFIGAVDGMAAGGDVHLRARDYDPTAGVFRSDDPAGVDGHRYGFGAPTAFVDPDGELAFLAALAVAALAGAGIGLGIHAATGGDVLSSAGLEAGAVGALAGIATLLTSGVSVAAGLGVGAGAVLGAAKCGTQSGSGLHGCEGEIAAGAADIGSIGLGAAGIARYASPVSRAFRALEFVGFAYGGYQTSRACAEGMSAACATGLAATAAGVGGYGVTYAATAPGRTFSPLVRAGVREDGYTVATLWFGLGGVGSGLTGRMCDAGRCTS